MRVLIVYDSVSAARLTAKVAETIGATLKEKGIDSESFSVKDVDVAKVKDFDCLLVGGPTMYFRMSSGTSQFLDKLSKGEFSGKAAAAFDTQLQSRMSGNASKAIDGRLKKLGFKTVVEPLVVYVEGKMNQQQMKEGELEKTKNWTFEVAQTLIK
jgi:flavorubredoxin